MKTFKTGLLLSTIAAALCGTLPGNAYAGSLVTPDQQALDKVALTLQAEPTVKAAREAVVKRWSEHPAAGSPDGKATMTGAIDEVVFHSLRCTAAADPTQPQVGWTLAPAYATGKQKTPGSRLAGDNPDRIYRFVAADPAYHYEIHGQRGPKPAQHEFSFEASSSLSLVAPAKVALYSKDIDVAADGSFFVTADSTPANGRRNHLQLPEGTRDILIRDTLRDWSSDYNQITVKRLDGIEKTRSRDEIVRDAAAIITEAAVGPLIVAGQGWKSPANTIRPFVRPNEWGVPGNVVAVNRFSVQDDEALVITLLPSGANYVGFQLTDPWSRSIDYWHHSSSLSDLQAKHNADGSITYVVSIRDPGVHNWLDTNGLHDGLILARWELFPNPLPPGDALQLVREARVVKLSELAAALPADTAKVTPAQRRQQLRIRAAEFAKRIALK